MDVALLHNAKAGDESFTPKKLIRLLKKEGYRATYHPLKEVLGDKKLLKEALQGKKLVVVAGGDGSLRKTANRLAGSHHTIAALPIGTANNIAHSLGITGTPEEIVGAWAKAKPRKIDMGIAKGPWGKKMFIEGIGLGLIGRSIAIIDDIDAASGRAFSTKEDKMHRDLCVMAALAHEMPPTTVKLDVDGNKSVDDYLLLEVLNINRAGPGIELAGAADPSDGELDLVWASAHDRKALAQSIEKCLSESRYRPILTSRKIKRLHLAVEKCELRLDDKVVLRSEDFGKWTKDKRAKIEIAVKPAAISFLLPEKPPAPKEKPAA
jgi:diacylglycerol kinase family enzyme